MKLLSLLALGAVSAFAGEKTVIQPQTVAIYPWSLKLDAAWVGEGDTNKGGSFSVFESRLQLAMQRPIDFLPSLGGTGGGWVLRVGAEWERFGFSHSDVPDFLPGTLQSNAAVIGLEYRTLAGLGAIFEMRPGFYYEHHVTSDSFDVPFKAAGVWQVNDRFALILGATYGGHRKSQFLPAAGIWWKITDKLTLNAIPPDPRLEYQITEKARIWLGGEINGGSFRTDAGRSDNLNAAVVSYTDYRGGAGVAWSFADGWSLDAGAGVSFYRKFDFHRAEVGVKSDDLAPYVKFSIRGEF